MEIHVSRRLVFSDTESKLESGMAADVYKLLEDSAFMPIDEIDLTNVISLSSGMLREFIVQVKQRRKDGFEGKIKLLNPSERVTEILRLSGTEDHFEILTAKQI